MAEAPFFVYRVVPQDRARRGQPPVTPWAGPSPSAAAAVATTARVLLLPPGLRVAVFRRDAAVAGAAWEPCGDCRVDGAARALAGL